MGPEAVASNRTLRMTHSLCARRVFKRKFTQQPTRPFESLLSSASSAESFFLFFANVINGFFFANGFARLGFLFQNGSASSAYSMFRVATSRAPSLCGGGGSRLPGWLANTPTED